MIAKAKAEKIYNKSQAAGDFFTSFIIQTIVLGTYCRPIRPTNIVPTILCDIFTSRYANKIYYHIYVISKEVIV